jgi:predicted MFS family arabinose efflux permease
MPAVPDALAQPSALRFVILLGIVSLFADMTYEGARGITGPYLAVLGASGLAVGVVAGLGELIGYGLRLASGYLADRTHRYWLITFVGYALNLFVVPLFALAGRWEVAAALMIAERVGKAVRTPARDAMLSHATARVGHGWGFGVHEALDQIGAVLGPLLVAVIVAFRGGYQAGFLVLLVPAVLALSVLTIARRLYPRPQSLETASVAHDQRLLPHAFWIYMAAAGAIAAGYADFPLIAYHFQKRSIVSPEWIPILYAIAMGVDAIAALAFGWLFDRLGLTILVAATVLSCLFAPLVFLGGFAGAVAGMALWGVGMGAQESILRAAIARFTAANRRATAYGIFNAVYGLAWFAGSALMGLLYDVSLPSLIAFSIGTQAAAVGLLLFVTTRVNRRGGEA